MSLSYDDLQAIRKAVKETVVDPIRGELEAFGNDIKEIYGMVASIQRAPATANGRKLSLEEKILKLPF